VHSAAPTRSNELSLVVRVIMCCAVCVPAADTNGCQSEACNSTANAVNGSCADVPAPGTGYTCNCSQGYAWASSTAQCNGEGN
jgi:hypothetical protein